MCSWVSQVPRPGPPGHSPSTMGLPGWAGRRRWGRLGSAEDICPCPQPCDGSAFTVLAELRRCGLTDSETCLRSLTLSLAGGQTVSADPGARGGAASLMQVTTARALTLVWAASTRHGLRLFPPHLLHAPPWVLCMTGSGRGVGSLHLPQPTVPVSRKPWDAHGPRGPVLSPSSWELPTARTRRHLPELPRPWRVGRGQALTPLPGETTLPACCSQVIVIKASGEVFVNQIYTQLPISAGEGRAPASPTSQRVPHLTPHGDPRPLCPQPTSHSSDPRPSSSSPRQTWACRWTSSWCPPCRCS